MTGCCATLWLVLLRRENKKRDAGMRDERLAAEDVDALGDDHPSSRYTY